MNENMLEVTDEMVKAAICEASKYQSIIDETETPCEITWRSILEAALNYEKQPPQKNQLNHHEVS